MLERPDLPDEKIIACLREAYGVFGRQITFLPLGADVNTAVYRVIAEDETPYFVKLRRGVFDEIAVVLPKFLSDQGLTQIIPPLPTSTGQLWAELDAFKLILYPFVEGRDAYQVRLSERHWRDFGAALQRLHALSIPPTFRSRLTHERYSPEWRATARFFLARVADESFVDPVAAKLAAFLKSRRAELLALIERAEQLAQTLQTQPPEFVLCHTDVHPGNILIDVNDAFYIVDWDAPLLAPKERDLMFIGGGQGFVGYTAQKEETLFYRGYGPTRLHPAALAYYRYERIIQDIAAFCEQLLGSEAGGPDRAQAFQYLTSSFLPGGAIEAAYQSDFQEGVR